MLDNIKLDEEQVLQLAISIACDVEIYINEHQEEFEEYITECGGVQ